MAGSTLSNYVVSTATIEAASSPVVQSLRTGLIAAYHTVYADRVRVYSTASVLEQLLTDGFTINSPAYKAAEKYAAAPNAPAQFCVGRRALPPLQTLQLQCTDGTVGDAYAVTVLSPAGVSTQLSYTNVINPGVGIVGSTLTGNATLVPGSTTVTFASAQTLAQGAVLTFSAQTGVSYTVAAATTTSTTATLTTPYTGAASTTSTIALAGTSALTLGSTAVTFSVAQTIAAGALLMFASQPGTYYVNSAAVTAATTATLSQAYQGPTVSATPTTTVGVLAGTFDVVPGSATVVCTASQVAAVSPGDSVQFSAQPSAYYTVLRTTSVSGVFTIVLTTPYSGTLASAANASDVCKASTAAAALAYQAGLLVGLGTISVVNTPSPAFATIVQFARTDGQLTDIQSWRTSGFNGVNGAGNLELSDITADPGIQTDLAAMVAANGGAFYGIFLDSNSQAEIESAAAFVEGQGGAKTLWANSSDYGNGQVGTTTDVFSELQIDSYVQSLVQQNNQQLLCYAGAATCGQMLAMNPGSWTAAYKSLPGVPADSDSTLTNSEALVINTMTAGVPGPGGKNGNYYKSVSGQNWLFPGTAPSGQFFDLTVGLDWLRPQIQAAVAATLASLPKVPFDDFGLNLIGQAILGVLQLAASPAYNFLLPDGQDPDRPMSVFTPKASSLTSAQRASRDVSGFTWTAGLTGAVETAVVNGTLIP